MKISDKGFSLLEVIIAMAIFAIGAGGLYGMQLTSAKGNTKANQQSGAVAAGTRFAEQLMRSSSSSNELKAEVEHSADKNNKFENFPPPYQALWTEVRRDAPYITAVSWDIKELTSDLRGIFQIALTVDYAENRQVKFIFLKIQLTDR